MGVKELPNIANYADLHLQPVRRLHITVEVIDKDGNVIETIQGLSTGGSINVSGSSLIRRTGNLSFVLIDSFLPKKGSILWMTNKIRVYAGIENLSSSDAVVTHFCLGTFYITEPKVDISNDSNSISITLQDNMMRWEQEELETKLKIDAGTPLNTAVSSLMSLYGEWNVSVEFTDLKIPYTLEFEEGETIMSVLTTIRDLYMDWECFYDVDGTFVFRKMEIQKENGEPIAWRFEKESDLITSLSVGFTYKDIKNRVVVIGQINDKTGITPKAESSITLETSPFHKNEIGVKTKVITESSYGTVLQCESRARYELFKMSTFQEKITISTVPIYYLDANNVIEVVSRLSPEAEQYVIDSISIGLGVGDEMSIQGHKLYYDHFDTNGTLAKYQQTADIVINGIQNLGWLSLAEKRISDYFGLEGDGSKLIVRFEYQGKLGITAYVTGYVGDRVQTLTIDLADFEGSSGDSGDNGVSKADYSDRILGHEMVHAVMNNSLSVKKTMMMPEWFKEGVAEFLHGADERLKTLIVTDNAIDNSLLTGLVSRSIELLNGAVWQSESKDYGASYIILKYLDSKFSVGKNMKTFMWSIKQSVSAGDVAVKEAIVENTGLASYEEFVRDFNTHAVNYLKFNVTLNIGQDEVDTGSIGGSDHHGSSDLNAEDVFDNTQAVEGVSAVGFKVEFQRP